MNTLRRHWRLVAIATAVGLIVISGRLEGFLSGQLGGAFTRAGVEGVVASAGAFGPLLVILLMTIAVVLSPIPSAPIALAAGAAYGDYWGTVYIVAGAESGALVAFAIARVLGRETLVRWFGKKIDAGSLGSQNTLAFAVFASRLMPFVSFDIVSYAAGLSCLQFWRFAVATLAGIIPASFVLAHVGSVAVSSGYGTASLVALGLGLATAVPVLFALMRRRAFWLKGDKKDE